MTENTWDVGRWCQPANHLLHLLPAYGLAIVTWPSGRITFEQYAGTCIMTELELEGGGAELRQAKEQNLDNTMLYYQWRTERTGYWIRQRRERRKARRFASIQWIKPSEGIQ